MEIETAANPADDGVVTLSDPVQEASSQAASEEATVPAGESDDTLEDLTKAALGETEAKPEDEIEVEYEGETFKLPPKLRDALLRHQDYTRKTMEVAEQRKALEQAQATFKANAALISQDFEAHTQLGALNLRIQQLKTMDTSYWTDEDIQAGVAELNALQQQANGIAQTLQQRNAQRQALTQQERAKALSEAAARVPNFTDQRRQELETLATELGFDPRDVANIASAHEYEVLHYADIGRKFIERQRKAAQMRGAQAGTPATMLGSASSGGKDPADMSEAEYIAWRQAGNG
jgi:hypothetical protein